MNLCNMCHNMHGRMIDADTCPSHTKADQDVYQEQHNKSMTERRSRAYLASHKQDFIDNLNKQQSALKKKYQDK